MYNPAIIRIAQINRADMDLGPVISFTCFPIIISNVQTKIAPRIPSNINTTPFFFIHRSFLSRLFVLSSVLCLFFVWIGDGDIPV